MTLDANFSTENDPGAQVSDLHVKAHLMTLNVGLFCIYQSFSQSVDPHSGLPAVRIDPAFDGTSTTGVTITMIPASDQHGTAALVKITKPEARIVITVYQQRGREEVPQLQVLRLSEATAAALPTTSEPELSFEVMAHVQRSGDLQCRLGEWIGVRGSHNWIEGYALTPEAIPLEDLEYQAILGRNWASPWVRGGDFSGSRGMSLPLLGLRIRLRGPSADAYDCHYSATFVDGSTCGPVINGEACEAESHAPLEAFQVNFERKSVIRLASQRRKARG
jgi:hypothetical protein